MFQSIIHWFVEISNIPVFRWPDLGPSQVLDVLIVAVLLYLIIRWIKRTQAWVLLKGIAFIVFLAIVAVIFDLDTVQWLMQHIVGVGPVIIVILFQPELRKVLEQIGRGQYLSLKNEAEQKTHSSAHAVDEIIKAVKSMGASLTGALIVLEQEVDISEYESRGTHIDAQISARLLMNIFERNAPLHDGAVVVRENRISSAACILPLTEESVDSSLGTRHRAAIGITEVSDARVVVVSEETGTISIVVDGKMTRRASDAQIRDLLIWGEPTKSRFGLFYKKRDKGGQKSS